MYQFVDELPMANLTSDFLILKEAENAIKEDWFEFCDYFICNEIKHGNSSLSKKQEIKDYKAGSNNFIAFSSNLKNVFGFDSGLGILDFKFNAGIYSIIIKTSYQDMLHRYYNDDKRRINNKTFTARNILSRFFIFQKYKGKLLFPLTIDTLGTIKYNFANLFNHFTLYAPFKRYLVSKSSKNYSNYEIKAFHILLCSTIWEKKDDISNEDINSIQSFCSDEKNNIPSRGIKNSLLNKLRTFLIENGNTSINTPTQYINSIRTNHQSNSYPMKEDPFEWLSINERHKLYNLKTDANLYLKRLHADGMKTLTRKKYMVSINHLFRYIILEQENQTSFDENSVNLLFDTNNSKNFFLYLHSIELTERTIFETIGHGKTFLEFCGLMTPFAKKHLPKRKVGKRTITARNAMPLEMINHLKDILMKRPPKPSTVWQPKKADLSWWQHKDVYPVQPLMMLMHLNIPLRGGQLRHLCRNKSLIINSQGNVDRFVINTDKNVNRSELQEIPNVWQELNILSDYLKWNQSYFPHLPKYTYNNEDNTPWEDIEPLFLIPNSLQPITAYQHKLYLTKLLCFYQIELNESFEKGEIKHKLTLAWNKDSNDFFKTKEELDQAPDTYLSTQIEVAYDIHSIRVTGITRYLQAGVNLNVLLMLTGHVDYNMIVNVYTKLTQQEKKSILRSAVEKLRFDQPENLVDNIESFIYNEIPSHYDTKNPKDIKRAFRENGLFSMQRKATMVNNIDIQQGVDLAAIKHPTSWFPMISGICPGVQCPEGRERRCSLCSYFITGKIFLNGVIHMANMKMAEFTRLSKEHTLEKEKSGRYCDSKSSKLELLVEELIGWHQIIERIENEMKDANSTLPIAHQQSLIEYEETPEELSYLETCYNAKLMGVEQETYGLKLLTIKAISFASKIKDNKVMHSLLKDENNSVDFLMKYYLDYKQKNLLNNFMEHLDFKE